jgi:hypothetical protein
MATKGANAPDAARTPSSTSPVPAAPAMIHAASRQRSPAMVMAGSANSNRPLGFIAAAITAQTPASRSSSRRRSGFSAARADSNATANAGIDIR